LDKKLNNSDSGKKISRKTRLANTIFKSLEEAAKMPIYIDIPAKILITVISRWQCRVSRTKL
jgi:hypothetical protein